MSDDKSKRGKQDRSRINMNEDYEVRYWSKKLGLSKDGLKRATSKFGSLVSRFRKH